MSINNEAKNTGCSTGERFQPAARGSLRCFCVGEVITVLRNYGWLMVYGDVDDPAVGKHGGDVYFHKNDVIDGKELRQGDVVTFYLYVDDYGLGAEECRVEPQAADTVDAWAEVSTRIRMVFEGTSFDEDDECDTLSDTFNPWQELKCAQSDDSTGYGTPSESEDEALPETTLEFQEKGCTKCAWASLFPLMHNIFKDMSLDEDEECDGFTDTFKPWQESSCALSDASLSDETPAESENEILSAEPPESEDDGEVVKKALRTLWHGLDLAIDSGDECCDVFSGGKVLRTRSVISSTASTTDDTGSDPDEETFSGTAGDSDEEDVSQGSPSVSHLLTSFRPPPGLSLPPWRNQNRLCCASAY